MEFIPRSDCSAQLNKKRDGLNAYPQEINPSVFPTYAAAKESMDELMNSSYVGYSLSSMPACNLNPFYYSYSGSLPRYESYLFEIEQSYSSLCLNSTQTPKSDLESNSDSDSASDSESMCSDLTTTASSSSPAIFGKFIKNVLNYSPYGPKEKPRIIPNSFQDDSDYFSYFEHGFFIELDAILEKALKEVCFKNSYLLSLDMKERQAFVSTKTLDEADFANEIRTHDLILIIGEQLQIPSSFEDLQKRNIKWTLGLVYKNMNGKNTEIKIMLGENRAALLKSSTKFLVTPIGNVSSLKREYRALIQIGDCLWKEQILRPQQKQGRKKKLPWVFLDTIRSKYNGYQLEAIVESIRSDDNFTLIQGPPGSGKTSTIVGILSGLFLDEMVTVQICAQSNAAVDEIASKILKMGIFDKNGNRRSDIKILRIGNKRETHELGAQEEIKTSKEVEMSINSIKLSVIVEKMLEKEGIYNPTNEIRSKIHKLKDIKAKINRSQRGGNHNLLKKLRENFNSISDEIDELETMKKRFFQKKEEFSIQTIKSANIILCTLSIAGSALLRNVDSVDYLIIDEACQSLEASTLIPFSDTIKSIILIGDQEQLPATTFSKKSKINRFDRSLFERMINCNIQPIMLRKQYRMMEEINDFVSQTFYNGELETAKSVLYRPIPLWVCPSGIFFFNLETSQEIKPSNKESLYNESEAQFVLKLYALISKKIYNTNASIGIISPYREQVDRIEDLLYKRYGHSWKNNCEVSSVDGFQGREVDLVILSTVRSQKLGFLKDERRINVAVSRAKYGMFAVGNEACLSSNPKWRALLDYSMQIEKYKSCRKFEDVKHIFNIF